ncbi:hypothetical protein BE221DRAFT_208497 [Ostreococcus tauri]|uniref:enoyl-[acyl-carrier-protein] reductase n=1 Tax=Ostreococcus tauri TaxID=70448 RepID=A0A1Y5I955_OSTTA|nr:hypothetical protein BE221DRAFT_208497 [Ostreococcus tauri]
MRALAAVRHTARRAHTQALWHDVLTFRDDVPVETTVEGDRVRVRILASPVNPSDVNAIEGTYPGARAPPRVPGAEGVGEITEAGPASGRMVVRRWNVAKRGGASAKMFDVIDRDVPVHEAAMITVNPCTAWRLLEDSGAREGETVVVNAATSGVGRALLQLARGRGIRTIAMCRPRESAVATEEAYESLRADGADVVLADTDSTRLRLDERTRELASRARFGFNAVGGHSAQIMLRLLQPRADRSSDEIETGGAGRLDMLARVSDAIRSGTLRTPLDRVRDVPLADVLRVLRTDADADARTDVQTSIGRRKILIRA